ncbi:hypothetical protein NODU109028_07500 [Nocardioides dubius]|uniref:Uncharacterized protein n=1 Tax=Nocardioides dubius TaxID=317019 RepID=A0ABP4EJW2_9ACTN
MSNRGLRSFSALAVIVASALPGFAGAGPVFAAPVAAVAPSGGCWWYQPAPGAELGDLAGGTSLSTQLEPWAAEPAFELGTAGGTAVGGSRAVTLALDEGPLLPGGADSEAREAEVALFVDVVAPDATRTSLDPVALPIEVAAAATSIGELDLSAEALVPLEATGAHLVELRQVIFSVPVGGVDAWVVCNGQTAGDPAGDNPVTAPLPTDLSAGFDVVAATVAGIDAVDGQQVGYAARAGDRVRVSVLGFASLAGLTVQLCPTAAGAACASLPGDVSAADAAGAATVEVVVPVDAASGPGVLRVATVPAPGPAADASLTVLGVPAVEIVDAGAKRIKVAGEQWDPLREVRLRALDEEGARIGAPVRISAGALGAVTARLKVPAGAEVAEVVARQPRGAGRETLEARVSVDAEAPAPGDDGDSGDTGSVGDTGSTSTDSTQSAAEAPALVDVPEPDASLAPDLVDAEQQAIARAGDVVITQATLVGESRLVDLFGAGPQRTLRLRAHNVGEEEAVAPGLEISVGKGDDLDPIYRSDGFARLGPGESLTVEVPIALPVGAFGTYTVAGQIGEDELGRFSMEWQTYPWGLLALNGLGVLLVAWALRRRLIAAHAPAAAGVPIALGASGAGAADGGGDAVVDLAALEQWWAEPGALETMDDAVVDVAAVERWLERCAARNVASL